MKLDVRIRRIEDIVHGGADPTFSGDPTGYTAFSERLRYRRLTAVASMPPECRGLVEFGAFTEVVRTAYAHQLASPGLIASGLFQFTDFGFFGPCCLPVDLPTSTAVIGSAFDWEHDFNRFYLSHAVADGQCNSLGVHDDGGGFSVELGDAQTWDVYPASVILAHPGQNIYGHWLLDILPRLLLLSKTGLHESLDIYIGLMPPWAAVFLEAFGVRRDRIRHIPPGLTRFRRAMTISSTKAGHRLGQPLMRDSWLQMKNFAETANRLDPKNASRLPYAEKIFVSRSKWRRRARVLSNAAELEQIAVAAGYRTIHPEDFSPLEQAAIFRRARAIVGEDGSALHNIIYSEPGCVLGIVGVPERLNLWHLGICHALDHQAAYMQAEAGNEEARTVDLVVYREMLAAIEAHVT